MDLLKFVLIGNILGVALGSGNHYSIGTFEHIHSNILWPLIYDIIRGGSSPKLVENRTKI